MQPEANFKRRLVASFQRHVREGWYTYLVKGPGQKDGLPDLLFGQQQRDLLWVEAKMSTSKPRASQDLMHARLIQSYALVIIVEPYGRHGVEWRAVGTDASHTETLGSLFWSEFFGTKS
jgi:hypothetical protein